MSDFNREDAETIAKKESARADMKQHADKLIQGFEDLEESHAKRAIWELVQNACDLSNECEVIIDFSDNSFSFTHNGKPFSSKTLIFLIKQVSSKSSKNEDEVGQFGTGFITTHSFGKKIKLNSVLAEGSSYIEIKDFLINRQAKDSDELLDLIEKQQENVYSLIRTGGILDSPTIKTTFSYISEHEQELANIRQAENNLHHYIPIVLTLNPALKSVKIISSDNAETLYRKGEETSEKSIFKTSIFQNGISMNVFSLKSEDEAIQVILPLSEINTTKSIDESIAKLFLYYPLVGTEKWGCNFIIHAKTFAPAEQRDGVYIKSTNEQTREKEKYNRDIIETASEMICQFLKSNSEFVLDPINLAIASFDTKSNTELINKYYEELKQSWVNNFKLLKLVETKDCRKTPLETLYIHPDLLLDSAYYDSIYNIISMFWNNIPKKEIAQRWTNIVVEWNDSTIQFLTIDMLIGKIQEQGNISFFDENCLRDLYEYLVKYQGTNVFDNSLLPNIKGEFVQKGSLRRPVNIDSHYIPIIDVLIPDVSKKFIRNDFELGLEYESYNRKKLSEDFNTKILSLISNRSNIINEEQRNGLISLCCIYPSTTVSSTRRNIMPKICNFYELEYKEQIVPNIEDEKFDYDYTPLRGIVKKFLLDIMDKEKGDVNWVINEITSLKEYLAIITHLSDLEDLVEDAAVFPNQNYILCKRKDLRIEKQFPEIPEDSEFLKAAYKDIIGDIKKELVLDGFSDFLAHTFEQKGTDLSKRIETELEKQCLFEKITEHPRKNIIFQIIQRITDNKEWESFFPIIDNKKAIIMMAKISNEEVKNDLFAIIGMEDEKIALLGNLSKKPDLERIIALGEKAVEEQDRNNADFDFKKKIGVHIENLIREKIRDHVQQFSIGVEEKQNGQDMVVKMNDEIVYYIEVKSRWDNRNSIIMSNSQIKNATRNKNCYSLCCVEMSDYHPEDGNRHEVKNILEIVDRIKVLNDIGYRIEPLISNALSVENKEDEVKLTDEYRATVPQKIINTGMTLDGFANHLITKLGLLVG